LRIDDCRFFRLSIVDFQIVDLPFADFERTRQSAIHNLNHQSPITESAICHPHSAIVSAPGDGH